MILPEFCLCCPEMLTHEFNRYFLSFFSILHIMRGRNFVYINSPVVAA
jgi:hypothetical protein